MTTGISKDFLKAKIEEAGHATEYPDPPAWLKHVQCKGQPSGRLTVNEAHLLMVMLLVDDNEPADGESAEQEAWLELRNLIEFTFTSSVGKRVFLSKKDEFMVGPDFSLFVTMGETTSHPFTRFCSDMASY